MRAARQVMNAALAIIVLALAACNAQTTAADVDSGASASSDEIAQINAVTSSPSGTSIPTATRIIDASGNSWTLADGMALVNGARAGFNANTTAVLFAGNTIYTQNAAGLWFAWTGTTWVVGDPRKAMAAAAVAFAAATGLPTIPASTSRIVDSSGNAWTLVDGFALINGARAGFNANTNAIVLSNSKIYSQNLAGLWFSWTGNTWITASAPEAVAQPSTVLPSIPVNATRIVDATGATWTLVDGFALINGARAGFNANTVAVVLARGIIYTQNTAGLWFAWTGTTWTIGEDPRQATGQPATPVPPVATPSANLTAIPANATRIVDATGAAWSLVDGIALINGVRAGGNANTVAVVFANSTIYSQNRAGLWFSWTGTQWVGATDPYPTAPTESTPAAPAPTLPGPGAVPASADFTTIPTNASSILDAAGGMWTLVNGVALINGKPAGGNANTTRVVYARKVIYSQNAAGLWFIWTGATWTVGQDPALPVAGAPAPTTAPVGTLTSDTNRPNNSTFVIGEQVVLTFRNPTGGTVSVRIVDELGNAVASATVALQNGVGTYIAPSARYGYYRVNASMVSDGSVQARLGTRPAGFTSYAVVPDPALRVDYGDELSRFGMQGGFAALQGSVIPYLGVRYVLGVPAWSQLEPNGPGQLAARVAAGQLHQKEPILDAVTYNGRPWRTYEIAQVASSSTPSWAGPLPGTAGSHCTSFGALNQTGVQNLPGFASALGTWFSRSYPTQTKRFYQVTWEPENPWCFGGSAAQLVQYYALTYAALHAADPNAQVMGPTLFYKGNEAMLTQMYAAGLGNYLDAFSIHAYAPFPAEANGLIPALRAQMAQANAATGRKIPFFGTENGLASGEIGELYQAYGNVRSEIILLGEGFIHNYAFYIADFWNSSATETNNTFGYYWNLTQNQPFGAAKIGPKPAAPAYSALTLLLDGSTTRGPVAGLGSTQHGYRFDRAGRTTLALWERNEAPSTITLNVPAQTLQVCDWMANCSSRATNGTLTLNLGQAPVYVIGQGL